MSSLNQYFSEPSFWIPDRFTKSGWIEHAPFAFWLMDAFRPQTIVELGTHSGYSFLCFCQAIEALNYPARAYAVDTWKGDEHAGFYSEDIYQQLSSYHSPRYSEFSELVRSTFDDARDKFADGSIDLLHIDGLHLYESVRHDFETWRSKLSPRAIVLFHDTNVHEKDFGVFQFWNEIKKNHPNFQFLHGHGLGVVGYGEAMQHKVKPLFDATHEIDAAEIIRTGYSRLGFGLAAFGKQLDLEAEVRERQAEVRERQAEVRERQAEVRERQADIVRLVDEQNIRKLQFDEVEEGMRHQKRHIVELEKALEQAERAREQAERAREALEQAREQAREQRAAVLNYQRSIRGASRIFIRAAVQSGHNLWLKITNIRNTTAFDRQRVSRDEAILENSGIFNEVWYQAHYPDVAVSGLNALKHYIEFGAGEFRNPNPLFDTKWYLQTYSDVSQSQLNALAHYAKYGWREGRDTHPRFSMSLYKSRFPSIDFTRVDPLKHALEHLSSDEISQGRSIDTNSELFDRQRESSDEAILENSGIFDEVWYQAHYPEVAASGLNALKHYIEFGAGEFRNPNPLFDTKWYLQTYPDVSQSQLNALAHYAKYGWREGRDTHPRFSMSLYKSSFPSIDFTRVDPLKHALEHLSSDEIARRTGTKGEYLSEVLLDVSGQKDKERVITLFATLARSSADLDRNATPRDAP